MQEYVGRMASQMLFNPHVEVSVGFPYITNITVSTCKFINNRGSKSIWHFILSRKVHTFGDENTNLIFILLHSFWQICVIFFCVYPEYLPIYGNLENLHVLTVMLVM